MFMNNEVNHLRDELVYMGEAINYDSILDTVFEGQTDDYVQINAEEADNDFSLDQAVVTMRNTYANQVSMLCATGLRSRRTGVNQP